MRRGSLLAAFIPTAFLFTRHGGHSLEIAGHVEFALQSPAVHIAHLAEDGPLFPGPVVFAETPGHPGETVGVASIEAVAVVEGKGGGKGLLRCPAPLEDLLAPVHAHVTVDLALYQQLLLLVPNLPRL